MVSTWRKMLKTRCVDGTNYEKIVHSIIIGNSMLDYADEMLALNKGREIIKGNTMVAA